MKKLVMVYISPDAELSIDMVLDPQNTLFGNTVSSKERCEEEIELLKTEMQ